MLPRTPARQVLASVLLLFSFATSAPARSAQGPIGGIQTKEYGTGAGYCSPPIMSLSWDPIGYGLVVKLQGITPCPNYPITEHWLIYGADLFETPYPLESQLFSPGAELYIKPFDALGAFAGSTSFQAVPNDPAMLGAPVTLQAIVGYGSNPMLNELGVSQGQLVVFIP